MGRSSRMGNEFRLKRVIFDVGFNRLDGVT